MEEALRAYIASGPAIAAIVGPRVSWGQFVQGATGPAVRLSLISSPREYHMQGQDALRMARVQADCRGPTYAAAKTLCRALVERVSGFKGVLGDTTVQGVFVETERDDVDQDEAETIYLTGVDLIIWIN